MERTEYEPLLESHKKCNDFSIICQQRVGLLEAYIKETDKIIVLQENLIVQKREEVDNDKRKRGLLYTGVGLLLGIIGGAYINSRTN